ncbi:hypothetical protein O181_077337 [Austropuccinia psidii MF-1]|uniref:Uncharacterized protein n=1 Tax=Austropuccinia psidii MF-1 TaxID=1389203 RepID=A0A9Q3FFT5_9BASI|nr:hypothetical protein [Austropuccinia psidii MF-1]
MPCKQILRQTIPGPSGTRWSKDLFHEPSQHNEPPIPGPSQHSNRHEEASAPGPEPEVAPMQSMEEPFACLATPASVIIINDTPISSPTPPEIPPRTPESPGAKLPSFPQ